MERQIGQMVRLIDDLLDVSRITSGKIVLQLAPTSVSDLVQAAVDAQRTAIETAKIELTVDMPPLACVVDVDPTRFGTGSVECAAQCVEVHEAARRIRCAVATLAAADIPRVAITISDTGAGISKDMLPRVFEMFTQAEPSTERTHGGLGIGLALARRLVDMHGGEIVADSDGLGQGSTFTITMPLCDAPAARASLRQLDLPRIACRVLIVDDNRDAANTMAMLLEELGGQREWLTTPRADWRHSRSFNQTSCSSTSACPESMAMKRVVECGSGHQKPLSSLRLRGGDRRKTNSGRSKPASMRILQNPLTSRLWHAYSLRTLQATPREVCTASSLNRSTVLVRAVGFLCARDTLSKRIIPAGQGAECTRPRHLDTSTHSRMAGVHPAAGDCWILRR